MATVLNAKVATAKEMAVLMRKLSQWVLTPMEKDGVTLTGPATRPRIIQMESAAVGDTELSTTCCA